MSVSSAVSDELTLQAVADLHVGRRLIFIVAVFARRYLCVFSLLSHFTCHPMTAVLSICCDPETPRVDWLPIAACSHR